MPKSEKQQLKTIMWRLFKARKVVTYDDLQELSGASRKYAQEWMAGLIKKRIARRISNGRYMLDEEAYFQSRRNAGKTQKDETAGEEPPQEPEINAMSPGRAPNPCRKERPEYRIWSAINDLKSFTFQDLVALNLGGRTMVRQYLALLKRAGILSTTLLNGKKKRKNEGRYSMSYRLTDKAGPEAPLVGRCFYIFDPNTGEYHTTDLMVFESEERLQEGGQDGNV